MRAIDELLSVPVIEGDVMFEEKTQILCYGDAELEAMSQAQKHLFRMGPQNVRTIQTKLQRAQSPFLITSFFIGPTRF